MLIDRIAILGVGLIGGSLARALKQGALCGHVSGYDVDRDNLRLAGELGVVDSTAGDIPTAVEGADVVVLATPLAATARLLREMRATLPDGALITDVGSSKGSVVQAARECLPEALLPNFVPGHPIAGTEKSGVAASFAGLFRDHLVILTPLPETAAGATDRIERMWKAIGARTVRMDVAHHDEVLAATSHLPHMLAYALVDCLAGMQERVEIFKYAAGGFADFTRIASSSPRMWNDICFANREFLIQVLDRFDGHMLEIRRAIQQQDSDGLLRIFTRAKQARDEFLATRGNLPPPSSE